MRFSKNIEYAFRALAYISAQDKDGDYFSTEKIANATNISPSYLNKVLNKLAQTNILISEKGPGKGYRMAKAPEEIILIHIVQTFEEEERLGHCFFGWEDCGEKKKNCLFHHIYATFKESLKKELTQKNITQIEDML